MKREPVTWTNPVGDGVIVRSAHVEDSARSCSRNGSLFS